MPFDFMNSHKMGIEIRVLQSRLEWGESFPIMQQLRTHLDEDRYFDYLETMTANGYRLFGMFVDDELVALAGVDILTNMYYGRHLWVYDLVTDSDHRSMGFGKELSEYLVGWAENI